MFRDAGIRIEDIATSVVGLVLLIGTVFTVRRGGGRGEEGDGEGGGGKGNMEE